MVLPQVKRNINTFTALWPCVVIGGKKSKRDGIDRTKSTLDMSALCRHAQDSM